MWNYVLSEVVVGGCYTTVCHLSLTALRCQLRPATSCLPSPSASRHLLMASCPLSQATPRRVASCALLPAIDCHQLPFFANCARLQLHPVPKSALPSAAPRRQLHLVAISDCSLLFFVVSCALRPSFVASCAPLLAGPHWQFLLVTSCILSPAALRRQLCTAISCPSLPAASDRQQ